MILIRLEDETVKAILQDIQQRMGNPQPAMKLIGEIVVKSVKENFRAQGRPTPWLPLAADTLLGHIGGRKAWTKGGKIRAAAERKAQGKQILITSKRLMNSITYHALANQVEIGTNVIYAAIQHFGGMAGRGKKVRIPARPFLMVQDEDWPKMVEVLGDYILSKT